ncbi:MAG: hypothetical protein K5872_14690 [Rhizobiaceae bacterium]|nr:hypothetical protein [Rhizobiaceae bacterium]MCV0407468.1 hypothetical protein [Rhizobiaceae bacterium]
MTKLRTMSRPRERVPEIVGAEDDIQVILRDIESEKVPQRLLELAQKLQVLLNDRKKKISTDRGD